MLCSLLHLFVISYNKDPNLFVALTETISRLLMCNVIICNSGNYCNSLAFSPYKDYVKRNIVKFVGDKLFINQVYKVPLAKLKQDQKLAMNMSNNPYQVNKADLDKITFKLASGFNNEEIEWQI